MYATVTPYYSMYIKATNNDKSLAENFLSHIMTLLMMSLPMSNYFNFEIRGIPYLWQILGGILWTFEESLNID